MTTHFSIFARRLSWTEEPGGPQAMGSQRVRYHWSNLAHSTAHALSHLLMLFLLLDDPLLLYLTRQIPIHPRRLHQITLFNLWSFPGVRRVSHRSVRATRHFLQILLRPLLTSGDRDGTAFMFPSPKSRPEFHSFIHRYTWHLVWNEWTHKCIKPIDRGVLRVPSSCHLLAPS